MKDYIEKICQAVYDKKGFNLLALDVRGISTVTDYLIIAEGSVDRHVSAIANSIIDELEIKPHHVEGMNGGDWVLIDYVDVIVHIFLPAARQKFRLEELWSKGKPVELNLTLSI
jgi:ribosome-associated protein